MTTNNKFYKDICEKLTDETITGFHGDGYYLRETCKVYGYTYQNKKCKVKYLHDMAESICGSTFTGQHTTLYYLKNIAEKLTGETYSNHTENYFLEIIKENITKPTPVPTYTDVELTATKNILSYADNDYTVFTGQLVDGGGVVERAGVVFDVSIDGVSQGTVTTNDEGKFSYRYDSRGVGDIEFTFSDRIFVSKTFALEDIYLYDELTSAKHTWIETSGDTVWSFTNDGLDTKGTSGGCLLKLDETLPSAPYSIELDVTGLTGMQTTYQGRTYTIYGGIATRYTIFEPDNQRTNYNSSSTSNYNSNVLLHTNDKIKAVVESNKVTYYINDVLVGTVNNASQIYNGELFIRNIGTSGIVLKNLKIREL